jgi:hypothetical protein
VFCVSLFTEDTWGAAFFVFLCKWSGAGGPTGGKNEVFYAKATWKEYDGRHGLAEECRCFF